MAYVIDGARCITCGWCRHRCPTGAVVHAPGAAGPYAIDAEWCIDCDLCAQACIAHCIVHDPAVQPAPAQLARARARARDAAPPAGMPWMRQPPWLRNHRTTREAAD